MKRLGLLTAALAIAPFGAIAAQTNAQINAQNAARPNGGDHARTTTASVSSTRANAAALLVEAAEHGDLAMVKSSLAMKADANYTSGDGMTALHWAADRGDSAMTTVLLKAGAKVTAKTRLGDNTPLHVAARFGRASVVRALLNAGADANARTSGGATALHLAAAAGNVEAVAELIKHNADLNARETEWGQTPLMFAAAANRASAITVLLKAKADPSLVTSTVDLSAAASAEQAATKKRNEALYSMLPQKVKDSLESAAVEAAKAAREARIAGAPNAAAAATARAAAAAAPAPTGPMYKITANTTPPTSSLTTVQIQQAIAVGRAELTKGTKANGPLEVADTTNGQVAGFEGTVGSMGGSTALHHAVRQGNTAAALALLDGGADINARMSSDSTTPLLLATLNGHFDLAMALVKRGADVKLMSTAGATPLYGVLNTQWAPRSRFPQPQSIQVQKTSHIELMTALLNAGADVNVRLKKNLWFFGYNNCGNANCGLEYLDGSTPFWRAAYAVDVEAMRLLQKSGADVNVPSTIPVRAGRGGGGGRSGAGGAGGAPAGGPDNGFANFFGGAQVPAVPLDPATDSAAKAVPPGTGVLPIHSAAGVGYGNGFAGNSHRHAPDGWMPAMKYLVEELHMDVNARDNNGYTPLHHAAARGDNEMILYLVSKGADVKAVARNGRTTVDMANGPVQRVSPIPETIALLEKLGAKNSHKCVSC